MPMQLGGLFVSSYYLFSGTAEMGIIKSAFHITSTGSTRYKKKHCLHNIYDTLVLTERYRLMSLEGPMLSVV